MNSARREQRSRDRFWSRVTKTDTCWLWNGKVYPYGYGEFWYRGHGRGAHRVAYTFAKGEIPNGMVVMHTCDNPICVNPEHLVLGTQGENVRDADSKGRRNVRGSANGFAKLQESDVLKMRELYSKGNVTQAQLAVLFSVDQTHVSDIVKTRFGRIYE